MRRPRSTLDHEAPPHLDVHLILGKSSTHKTPEIKRRLLAHPRLVVHFTPTSNCWVSLVERWFGELTNKKPRGSADTFVRQLNADIRAWIKTWNQQPRPYLWTKTADPGPQSIATYCNRISDSRKSWAPAFTGHTDHHDRNGSPQARAWTHRRTAR
jgi:hypothetical protein